MRPRPRPRKTLHKAADGDNYSLCFNEAAAAAAENHGVRIESNESELRSFNEAAAAAAENRGPRFGQPHNPPQLQ